MRTDRLRRATLVIIGIIAGVLLVVALFRAVHVANSETRALLFITSIALVSLLAVFLIRYERWSLEIAELEREFFIARRLAFLATEEERARALGLSLGESDRSLFRRRNEMSSAPGNDSLIREDRGHGRARIVRFPSRSRSPRS